MRNKKRRALVFMLSIICTLTLIVGCSSKKTTISDFVKTLQDNIDYEVEYIEDRKAIRVVDYLSKDTVVDAVSRDVSYQQWVDMREDILGLYDEVKNLGESNKVEDVEYEIVIIDKDSANTDSEVPLLIVDKTGILFDMVDEARSR